MAAVSQAPVRAIESTVVLSFYVGFQRILQRELFILIFIFTHTAQDRSNGRNFLLPSLMHHDFLSRAAQVSYC